MSKEQDNKDLDRASWEGMPSFEIDSGDSLMDSFVIRTIKTFKENVYLLDIEDAAIFMFEQLSEDEKSLLSFMAEYLTDPKVLREKVEKSMNRNDWDNLIKQEAKRFKYDQLYDSGTPG